MASSDDPYDPPPTRAQHQRICARLNRNYTDDPRGTHHRPGVHDRHHPQPVPHTPDILRRNPRPEPGEHTTTHARWLRRIHRTQWKEQVDF